MRASRIESDSFRCCGHIAHGAAGFRDAGRTAEGEKRIPTRRFFDAVTIGQHLVVGDEVVLGIRTIGWITRPFEEFQSDRDVEADECGGKLMIDTAGRQRMDGTGFHAEVPSCYVDDFRAVDGEEENGIVFGAPVYERRGLASLFERGIDIFGRRDTKLIPW